MQLLTSSTPATEKRSLCAAVGLDKFLDSCTLLWLLVGVSIFAIASFMCNVYQWCKSQKATPRADKERDNDSFKSGVEMSNNNMEMRQRLPMRESTLYDNGDHQNGARNSRVVYNAASKEVDPLLPDPDPMATDAAPGSSLDEALRILENRILPHPGELDRLMRNVLGFSAKQCEEIKAKPEDNLSKVRCAFHKWISIRGNDANAEALVRALKKNKWNYEAEEIAKALGVERMEVPGVEIIRGGIREWERKQASKATVLELVAILHEAKFVDVVHEICDKLHIQATPQEDKAAPNYKPQEQPDDQPVREMAQATVDEETQSRTSSISHSDAASSDTSHSLFSQTNDSFAIKLDDGDVSETIVDMNYVEERNASNGKESSDQFAACEWIQMSNAARESNSLPTSGAEKQYPEARSIHDTAL